MVLGKSVRKNQKKHRKVKEERCRNPNNGYGKYVIRGNIWGNFHPLQNGTMLWLRLTFTIFGNMKKM